MINDFKMPINLLGMNKPLLKPYGTLILCMELPQKSLGVQCNDEGKHMALDLN